MTNLHCTDIPTDITAVTKLYAIELVLYPITSFKNYVIKIPRCIELVITNVHALCNDPAARGRRGEKERKKEGRV